MTISTITESELSVKIAAERRDLARVLSDLPASAWDAETLCAGWRVREVVAHMTMPFRYSAARFAAELARSGGRFNAMSDRIARRDAAAVSAADLLSILQDNATNPWKPPGGGYLGALTHDVIHGLDITVPLGIGRRVPADRLRAVLDAIAAPKARKHFGTDLSGVRLRAEDIDWASGSGQQLSGTAQDLALVLCGRKLPPGRLHGEHAARFTG
ncbi:MAG TPA: maleylpyruvate isomerase family mycothiol-dependent enzyme [Streptosporangiaceae bacterium]